MALLGPSFSANQRASFSIRVGPCFFSLCGGGEKISSGAIGPFPARPPRGRGAGGRGGRAGRAGRGGPGGKRARGAPRSRNPEGEGLAQGGGPGIE